MSTGQSWRFFTCLVTSFKVQGNTKEIEIKHFLTWVVACVKLWLMGKMSCLCCWIPLEERTLNQRCGAGARTLLRGQHFLCSYTVVGGIANWLLFWHLTSAALSNNPLTWSSLQVIFTENGFCFVILPVFSSGQVVYAHQFVNLTGENLTDTSLFEEHLCSLLCDLTGLAMGKYSKVGG